MGLGQRIEHIIMARGKLPPPTRLFEKLRNVHLPWRTNGGNRRVSAIEVPPVVVDSGPKPNFVGGGEPGITPQPRWERIRQRQKTLEAIITLGNIKTPHIDHAQTTATILQHADLRVYRRPLVIDQHNQRLSSFFHSPLMPKAIVVEGINPESGLIVGYINRRKGNPVAFRFQQSEDGLACTVSRGEESQRLASDHPLVTATLFVIEQEMQRLLEKQNRKRTQRRTDRSPARTAEPTIELNESHQAGSAPPLEHTQPVEPNLASARRTEPTGIVETQLPRRYFTIDPSVGTALRRTLNTLAEQRSFLQQNRVVVILTPQLEVGNLPFLRRLEDHRRILVEAQIVRREEQVFVVLEFSTTTPPYGLTVVYDTNGDLVNAFRGSNTNYVADLLDPTQSQPRLVVNLPEAVNRTIGEQSDSFLIFAANLAQTAITVAAHTPAGDWENQDRIATTYAHGPGGPMYTTTRGQNPDNAWSSMEYRGEEWGTAEQPRFIELYLMHIGMAACKWTELGKKTRQKIRFRGSWLSARHESLTPQQQRELIDLMWATVQTHTEVIRIPRGQAMSAPKRALAIRMGWLERIPEAHTIQTSNQRIFATLVERLQRWNIPLDAIFLFTGPRTFTEQDLLRIVAPRRQQHEQAAVRDEQLVS